MPVTAKISLRSVKSGIKDFPQRRSRTNVQHVVRASQGSDYSVEAEKDRRAALAGLVGVAGLLSAEGNAEAKPAEKRDYYQELLSSTKNKPSTTDLLSKYEQVKNGPGTGGKKAKKSSTFRTSGATSKPSYSSSSSSGAIAPLNPVEVSVGLALVGGAALLGRKSSTRVAGAAVGAAVAPAKSRGTQIVRPAPKAKAVAPKPAPKRTKPPPPPSRPGTIRLGTQKKAVSAPNSKATSGTIKLKRGTAPAKNAEKSGGSNSSTAAAGFGVAILALVALVVFNAPDKSAETTATSPTKPAAAAKAVAAAAKPVADLPKAPEPKADAPAPAPAAAVVEAPKSAPVVAATPAPVVAAAAAAEPKKALISPVALAGGIAAILVAALVAGGGKAPEGVSSAQTSSSSSAAAAPAAADGANADPAEKRAAEARAWIAAWRSKQK